MSSVLDVTIAQRHFPTSLLFSPQHMADKLLYLAALGLLTVKVLPAGMGGLSRTLFPASFIRSHPVHELVWGLNMGTCESLASL